MCGLGLGIGAQNLPAQTFSRITTGPLVTDSAQRLASAWADFDGDGDLDAFLPTTANADNFLYRNLGGGTFQNLASSPAASAGGDSTSAIWGDYDND
ncbi:MAG TPA: hypothetical protein DCY13_00205, partial [Verrucomicrobiales bacterium]|nr:hypothetical protein [Verrucomicrobiales bacterium]